jgi:two-component system chemotaxis response regulator CheB
VPRRVVGIGASAGGVDALVRLVRHLPADLDAAVCVVLHVPATGRSLLAPILSRHTDLDVQEAEDGAPLERGRVYVAPPDRHLTIAGGRVRLGRGPKENASRPAVDPLLRSLAAEHGERAVAVILSGALGDGSGGAAAIAKGGGIVIVQDPDEATVPSMPESAQRAAGRQAETLAIREIGERLVDLASTRAGMRETVGVAPLAASVPQEPRRPDGPPTTFTCPECHGPLWAFDEGRLKRYQCRVGHAYSEESLVVEQGSAVETALWSALEALEERAELLERLAARFGQDKPRLHARHRRAARNALDRAELIRRALGIRGEEAHALDLQAEAAE